MDDHFKKMLQTSTVAKSGFENSTQLPFIPSARFAGSKPGYYFGTHSKGVGYYHDRRQQVYIESFSINYIDFCV